MYVEDVTTPRSESSTSSCQSFLKKGEEEKKNIVKKATKHNTYQSSLYVKQNRLNCIKIARAICSVKKI